jgi:hypothetical protein
MINLKKILNEKQSLLLLFKLNVLIPYIKIYVSIFLFLSLSLTLPFEVLFLYNVNKYL